MVMCSVANRRPPKGGEGSTPSPSSIEYEIAQLRHLYMHLFNGTFKSSEQLAVGLLGPVIERLETYD